MKKLLLLIVQTVTLFAANPAWLDRVEPLITAAQKKTYLSLKPEARREFEENFWVGKAITAADYFARLDHVDAAFGSSKPGSGANTDQGRVYLAIGPPVKLTRIPSSRIFVPLEIWYYDSVPGLLNTELRLIFFQKNNMGFPKLYSPQVDTIRALLLPEAATRSMFGPNDSTNESDIRGVLNVGPAEDEVITASVNVATGIKYSGNEEILGRISSPAEMLGKPPLIEVTSRLITTHPKLDTVQTASAFGGTQADLRLEATAQREIDIEVLEGDITVYQNQVRMKLSKAETVLYTHRLDLLPGSYRLIFTVDGRSFPYALEIPQGNRIGDIQRADLGDDVNGRNTPFEFDGRQLELNPEGRFAFVPLAQPGNVKWMIRSGAEVLWRASAEGQQIASVELPSSGIPPGGYQLEAIMGDSSTSTGLTLGKSENKASKATIVSFNANLLPAQRFAFVCHQWLLRGKLAEARRSLNASLAKGVTDGARIELARADAMAGNLDAARDQVKSVLAAKPDSFEALSVFAYIETRLQDYAVAAELYRRALAVQESPAVRAALSKLPAE